MDWDIFLSGMWAGAMGTIAALSIWAYFSTSPNQKYIDYTEHACVNLRMTHACKVLTENYKEQK